MVYSEVNQMMPSNGFGSPVSPPDVHFECREVPSPSQYSDPSYSPPSFHSPPHFASGIDKQETILKEEPASPYNCYNYNSGSYTTLNTNLHTDLPDATVQPSEALLLPFDNSQNFNAFQRPIFEKESLSKPNTTEVKNQHGMTLQKWDEPKTSLDYEIQRILSCAEELNAVETITQQSFMNESTAKAVVGNQFQQPALPQQQAQNFTMLQQKSSLDCQQSSQNQLQQVQGQIPRQFHFQQQLALEEQPKLIGAADRMKLLCSDDPQLNPETFTAISVPTAGLLSSHMSLPEQTQNFSGDSYPNFESIIDDGDVPATMNPNSNTSVMVDWLKTMLKKTIFDAGVPQNPYEWTACHVRAWLRKAATAFELKLPENIANLNIDGPTMLSLNPNQFNFMLASKGDSSLHAVTTLLVILVNKVDYKEPIQVKQEVQTDDQHIIVETVPAMIPTSVVNHSHNSQYHLQPESPHQIMTSVAPRENIVETKPSLDQFMQLPAFQQESSTQEQLQLVLQRQAQQHQQQHQLQQLKQQQQQQKQQQQQPQQQQQQQQQQPQQQQQQQAKLEQVNDTGASPYPGLQVNQNIQQLNLAFSFANNNSTTQPLNNGGSPIYAASQSSVAKTSSLGNAGTPKQVNMMPSPGSQPVPLQEGINSYINDSGDLSALLQQQSPQHPATLDLEESMDTDDDVEDDVPASCTGGSGRSHIQLWQFLKELLNNNKKYGSCIRWLDRQEAIFKIEDSVKVATLWGERKNRPQMNYDKLSRSIRQYYNKNIMKKTERSQRLVYQFCAPYGQ